MMSVVNVGNDQDVSRSNLSGVQEPFGNHLAFFFYLNVAPMDEENGGTQANGDEQN